MGIDYNRTLKCVDCKHSKASILSRLTKFSFGFRCTINESWVEERYDPVFGKITPGFYSSCNIMRIKQECGPEGKSWSPRNTKHVFLVLLKG